MWRVSSVPMLLQEVEMLEREWGVAARWEAALAQAGRGRFEEADVPQLGAMAADAAGSVCREALAQEWPLHKQLQVT